MKTGRVHAGSAIRFLTTNEVVALHDHVLERYGGATGLREPGQLDAAVHAPQSTFGGNYVYQDLFEMAAAYLQCLTLDHVFIDANKRTAWYATKAFLLMNGYSLKPHRPEIVEFMVAIADGRTRGRHEIAAWLIDKSEAL